MAVRRKRRVRVKKLNLAIFVLSVVLITALVTKAVKSVYTLFTTKKEPEVIEKKETKKKETKKEEVKETTTSFEQLSYYKDTNHNRYIRYQNANPDLPIETIVTYVNIGIDNPYYTYTNKAKYLNKTTILVNKYNYLTSDYVPKIQ